MKTAAIIPVFNNARTIGDVIKKTREHVDTVIVVDDGSTDGTSRVLQKLAKRGHCTVLTHQKNRGKGKALRTAIKHLKAKARKPEALLLLLDADGEHDPGEIPCFLEALGKADVVLGARTSHRSRKRALLNKWMASWFRLLDPAVSDPSCGFRALRWPVLEKLELRSSDFCIDAEMILEAIKARASVVSIPISYSTHSTSSVSRADFLRINNFFDRWVIRNARQLRLSVPRRVTLVAGAFVGKIMGMLLAKRVQKEK